MKASLSKIDTYSISCDGEALSLMPSRPIRSNKGDFGRVLCICGSRGMAGAAYLCAKAAYRSGAGLVEIFTHESGRSVAAEGTIDDERLEELIDEYVVLKGHELDVDDPLCEELMLGFPTRLLCSEDCEGLCPKCGKPRREGDCGCSQKEIDPRLAVLAHFFDEDEDEK